MPRTHVIGLLAIVIMIVPPATLAQAPPADQTSSGEPSKSSAQESTDSHQLRVDAWKLLKDAAADKKAARRQNAMLALATLGRRSSAVQLVEHALLHDEDSTIRQTAASALGEMKNRQAVPSLRKALDDDSAVVRFAAAKSLWDLGDHSGRDILIEVLEGESSPSEGFIKSSFDKADKKLHSPHDLIFMGINEASGAFLGPFSMGVTVAEQLMKDKTAPARALSATLLAGDHDPRSVRDLDQALGDKNWAVRAAAAKALGNYGCKALVPDLEPLLQDKKDEVKFMAAASLLKISSAPGSRIPSECKLVGPNAPLAATESASVGQQ